MNDERGVAYAKPPDNVLFTRKGRSGDSMPLSHMTNRNVLITACLIASLAASALAQKSEAGSDDSNPTSCAVIRGQLERSMVEFTRNGDPAKREEYLIIVLRPGRSEKNRKLSERRADAIKAFFDLRHVNQNVIFAEAKSDQTSRLGSAEVYIAGILKERFYFKHNNWRLCASVEESW